MKTSYRPDQHIAEGYYGRILMGNYSNQLKRRVTRYIHSFRAFDELASPAIPYISAWEENQNIIWYEFISKRLVQLLGCRYSDAAAFFRDSVIERHIYFKKKIDQGLQEEILSSHEVQGRSSELRQDVKDKGIVDAVYKISASDKTAYWLKDQAILQSFETDKICISLGNLTVVTKEMEAEENLKQTQKALRKSEQKFRKQAIHDNLTELYNTRYLYKALSALKSESLRKGRQFSLIFMDIDNFKNVVDTYGHLNASKALQEIAATIKKALPHPNYGVAYGGDEFVLVLPGSNKHRAMETAGNIRAQIKNTTYLQSAGLKIHVSASFGVSTYPQDAKTVSDLLALADQAMFNVKERGKDSVCGISYASTGAGNTPGTLFSYDCRE